MLKYRFFFTVLFYIYYLSLFIFLNQNKFCFMIGILIVLEYHLFCCTVFFLGGGVFFLNQNEFCFIIINFFMLEYPLFCCTVLCLLFFRLIFKIKMNFVL